MVDNRQFTDGTTIGGVDVYYEDKKLAESTSTTTMTTEGVLLKGTDGAFYEIDKTSLSEVIRAELGNILADNSKDNGTSVGKVPTLNSTGNALGASSVADLATVLSVRTANDIATVIPYSITDFNNLKNAGLWIKDYSRNMDNSPETSVSNIMLIRVERMSMSSSAQIYQTLIHIESGRTYFRRCSSSGDWNSWQRIDNFGCNTVADLANLLGVGAMKCLKTTILKEAFLHTDGKYYIDTELEYIKNGSNVYPVAYYSSNRTGWVFKFVAMNIPDIGAHWFLQTDTDDIPSGLFGLDIYYIN